MQRKFTIPESTSNIFTFQCAFDTHFLLQITAFHNKTIGIIFISTATASLDRQELQRDENTSYSA